MVVGVTEAATHGRRATWATSMRSLPFVAAQPAQLPTTRCAGSVVYSQQRWRCPRGRRARCGRCGCLVATGLGDTIGPLQPAGVGREGATMTAVLNPFPNSDRDVPYGAGGVGPNLSSYFLTFSRDLKWVDLLEWPPDAFAFANLMLDHSEAYRFAVAPPSGGRWPPTADWNAEVGEAAIGWRDRTARGEGPIPAAVARAWDVLVDHLGVPLGEIRRGNYRQVWEALLTIHAIADEACRSLASAAPPPTGEFERRAWTLMADHGSLSRIDSARIRVTPKTRLAPRGITIRSLSRYLALSYESVHVEWQRIEPVRPIRRRRGYNILIAPWPLELRAEWFHPVSGPLDNMDEASFGFFEFAPPGVVDLDHLADLVVTARNEARWIDALVLPEAAVASGEIPEIEELMARLGVGFLIVGVREQAPPGGMGRNYVHMAVRTGDRWTRFEQVKHHRWCLDDAQIRQYHLCHVLDPSKVWWEAIDIPARTMQIIDVGEGATTATLVCEDLARLDEVADLLRRIGPGLVVALLLDGPQLPQRWSCRYATVLSDDPGSAVLTVTALGMAVRSTPRGKRRSRAVAVWSDPTSGIHQIDLAHGASGVLLTTSVESTTMWTADGRRHDHNTPTIVLTGIHQLRTTSYGRSARKAETRAGGLHDGSPLEERR